MVAYNALRSAGLTQEQAVTVMAYVDSFFLGNNNPTNKPLITSPRQPVNIPKGRPNQ